jgi:Helix-turn-helix domain
VAAWAYNRGAMPALVPCFDLVLEMKNAFHCRLQLVTYPGRHGIKAAARAFRCNVPTVSKWVRRYQA